MFDCGLSPETIAQIKSVLSKHPLIQKTILYGSRAKGNFRKSSDIDLVLVAPALTLSDLLGIETEIDDLLIPYKVDLSLLHQIDNPSLIEHIERVGKEF